jgi:hypothetical protein
VNPRNANWKDLLPTVQAALPDVELVEFGQWLDVLATSMEKDEVDLQQFPAAELLN